MQNIINALKEILPARSTLRAPEGRPLILAHLSAEEGDWGFYGNGKPKFPNMVSSAVAKLREEGLVETEGWTWKWVGGGVHTQPLAPQPVSQPLANPAPQPIVEMVIEEEADLFEMFEEVDASWIYDLNDLATFEAITAATPCYGKYSNRDEECKGCPLALTCKAKTDGDKEAKKALRDAKAEAIEALAKAGFDFKSIKMPKSARLQDAQIVTLQNSVVCAASGYTLFKGEEAVFAPAWGIIHPAIYETLKSLK